jgi:hypothetical protein
VPLAAGGAPFGIGNTAVLCRSCNSTKGASTDRGGVAHRSTRMPADESYGMAVGAEVFDTVLWAGRFAEAARRVPVVMLPRRAVKLALCGDSRAKDANIRQALLDRFGGSAAVGRKAAPGPLYGISRDVWSALAIAVTYSMQSA